MVERVEKKKPVVLITVVIVVVIVSGLAVVVLLGGGSVESITAAEWNAEYAQRYNNPDGVMQFPSYDDGDAVVIAGTITDMEIRHQNESALIPYAFDCVILTLDGTQINGLEWEYVVDSMFNVGDPVEITFHIEDWSMIAGYDIETISEWDYNTILPSSTIKKV